MRLALSKTNKSFLVLFFKKELLAFFRQSVAFNTGWY